MSTKRPKQDVAALLRRMGACDDAVTWAETQTTYYSAWRACHRGDWLLWIAAMLEVDRRLVVRAACACARTALVHVPDGELRPLHAIETAEAWCRGEATIEQVRSAANAAHAARAAAHAANAARAACAAANASYAAHAAYAAARAAAYSAYVAAAKEHASIVRAIIPWSAVRDALVEGSNVE